VAFESRASNLVRGDTDQFRDIFVRDRQTGLTTQDNPDEPGFAVTGTDDAGNSVDIGLDMVVG
jgi:hypothetical protein